MMNVFESSDLYLSAYLHSKGLKLLKIDHAGRRAIFSFIDVPKREDWVREFFNRNATANISQFIESLKSLKGAIANL